MSYSASSSDLSSNSNSDNSSDIEDEDNEIQTSIIERQQLLTPFKQIDVVNLLNEYEDYDSYTIDEKKEYLTINSSSFTIQERFKIILYYTYHFKASILYHLKNKLFWDFDFIYCNFTYPQIALVKSENERQLSFYFNILGLEYNYIINTNIIENLITYDDIFSNDILYSSCINNIIYDFNMFRYIFDKVINYYTTNNLQIPQTILFNIINCNNLDFINNTIQKYNLDINYIDPVSKQHPLLFAFQRCSLNTILSLDKKYNCNIKDKIKNSGLYQRLVFQYLFKFINIENHRFYILHENERVKILKYFINVISNDIITTNLNELTYFKRQIKYDKIKDICINKLMNSNIENKCYVCYKSIIKHVNNYFFIDKLNSKIYHHNCFLNQDNNSRNNNIKVYIDDCSICLGENMNNQYVILSCGHMNCKDCMIEYIDYSSKCNICRDDYRIINTIIM